MAVGDALKSRKVVFFLVLIGLLLSPLVMVAHGALGDLFAGTPVSGDPTSGSTGDLLLLFFLFAPMVPYLICLLVLKKVDAPVLVLPAAVIALSVDVFINVDMVIFSAALMEGTGLFFAPFFNLFLSLPLGMLLGWLLTRYGRLEKEKLDRG